MNGEEVKIWKDVYAVYFKAKLRITDNKAECVCLFIYMYKCIQDFCSTETQWCSIVSPFAI